MNTGLPTYRKSDMVKKNVMLAGGGRFGKLALQRIPERIAIVADLQPDQEVAGLAKAAGAELWQRDAVEAVVEALAGRNRPVEWIIPMAPIHLLAKWIAADLARKNPVFGQVPDQLIPEVKMRHRGENGEGLRKPGRFHVPGRLPRTGGNMHPYRQTQGCAPCSSGFPT